VLGLNYLKLNSLPGDTVIYTAVDTAGVDNKGYHPSDDQATRFLDSNTSWPGEVELKIGAVVMLVTVSIITYSSCPDYGRTFR
jgi:hypothetical protein